MIVSNDSGQADGLFEEVIRSFGLGFGFLYCSGRIRSSDIDDHVVVQTISEWGRYFCGASTLFDLVYSSCFHRSICVLFLLMMIDRMVLLHKTESPLEQYKCATTDRSS